MYFNIMRTIIHLWKSVFFALTPPFKLSDTRYAMLLRKLMEKISYAVRVQFVADYSNLMLNMY